MTSSPRNRHSALSEAHCGFLPSHPRIDRLVHATLTQPLALTDGTTLPPLVDATALAREVEFAIRFPAPVAPRAAWSRASSMRSSRGTTSCGCSTTRATCSRGDDLAAAAQRPRARALRGAGAALRDRRRSHARSAPARRPAVRVRAPRHRRAGADRRRHARHVAQLARRTLPHGGPPMTHRSTRAARCARAFEPASRRRRCSAGSASARARCDLGDEGLYLAEEIVAADRWLGGSRSRGARHPRARADDRAAPGLEPACRSIPKGRLRTLVADILRVAKLDARSARAS